MHIKYAPIKTTGLLDLSRHSVYGWEKNKSGIKIRRFIEALEAGNRFPAVPVVERDMGFFLTGNIELDTGMADGGHHRAIAHLIAQRALPVVVLGFNTLSYPVQNRINIRDIVLVD